MILLERFNEAVPIELQLELFFRILVAAACGFCIGLERSRRLKEAGIRTHCVVACASAVAMIVSKYAFADLAVSAAAFFPGVRGADPARIAAQVISGIGFLGVGIIFRDRGSVKGITTAAGIWATAAIGLAVGSGLYLIGLFATLLIIVIQLTLHRLTVGNDTFSLSAVTVTVEDTPEMRTLVKKRIEALGAQIIGTAVSKRSERQIRIKLTIRTRQPLSYEETLALADDFPDVTAVEI